MFDITFTQGDPNLIYTTDDRYGIQKSIDGGLTWEVKNQGLTGMAARKITASPQDPRRVYAVFESWPGIFRSSDGAASWEFIQVWAGGRIVRVDPTDPNLLYLAGDSGFYKSTDGGTTWTVQTDKRNGNSYTCSFEMDPFQPGHFLVSVCGLIANAGLFSSADYGQTWEQMDVPPNNGGQIAFDPAHEGVAYFTAGNLFRSEDHGVTWAQIPNNIVGANGFNNIAIATHPQHIIVIAGDGGYRRSFDGGNTWTSVGASCSSYFSSFLFVDGNSARFYASSSPFLGLLMSANGLNTCTHASGALGNLNITAISYSMLGDQPVIYAATTGGSTVTASADAQALAIDNGLVKAGIYRYVQPATGISNIPILAAPANNVIVHHYTPLLDWSDVAANYHYQVQVDDNADFSSPLYHIKNLKTSEYQFSENLMRRATYYWRVRSRNVLGGTKGWSQVWSFTTGDVPAAFSKGNPLNNATNQPTILTLKWTKSAGVTPTASYEYCYDMTDDSNCLPWKTIGLNTSANLRGLLPEHTYYWQVRAFNVFGQTQANSSTWYSFTTGPTIISNHRSQPSSDGWMLESSETSGVASTLSASGKLRAGDDARNRQYRSLLAFDTSGVPDNAVISKVTLKIHKASVVGTDPFTTHGDLVADIKKGFFNLSPLELTDFNAAAEPVNIGKFTNIGGGWVQLTLSSFNFKYIDVFGATQFRIRFIKDDNNDNGADYIQFDSGGDANPPQLIIEYSVP